MFSLRMFELSKGGRARGRGKGVAKKRKALAKGVKLLDD